MLVQRLCLYVKLTRVDSDGYSPGKFIRIHLMNRCPGFPAVQSRRPVRDSLDNGRIQRIQ